MQFRIRNIVLHRSDDSHIILFLNRVLNSMMGPIHHVADTSPTVLKAVKPQDF